MKIALKIMEGLIVWAITIFVVFAFSRSLSFDPMVEFVIDALIVLALPLVWGMSFFTFLYEEEKFYSYAQSLAFPVCAFLGLLVTVFLQSVFGSDAFTGWHLLFLLTLVIAVEAFVEKLISEGRLDSSWSISKLLFVSSNVILVAVIGFLSFALLYGRLRLAGHVDGAPFLDELSLFVFNDLFTWVLDNV